MHNTHYVIISATDKEQARKDVIYEIDEYSSSNDSTYGVIDYILEVGNAEDKEKLQSTIDFLNRLTGEETLNEIKANIKATEKIIKDKENKGETISPLNYHTLSQYYNDLYQMTQRNLQVIKDENDIENCNDYFGWEFTEVGVTNMIYEKKYGEKVFVCIVNMHS